jgi:CRISPR system Cascade subunit CasA
MLGYRNHEKLGRVPVQFRERGLWRDFDSLLPDPKEVGNAPSVIQHAIGLTRKYPERFPRVTLALGQANDKAKIEFWRMERFDLPEALAGDGDLRTEIHSLLERSEHTQQSLWSACSRYAQNLLSRGDRKPRQVDIRGFLNQMVSIPLYWSILETRFHELLHAYTLEVTETEIHKQWLESLRDALRRAWEQHRISVTTGDAWAIRALVKAEAPVQRELCKLDQEIANLTPTPRKEDA